MNQQFQTQYLLEEFDADKEAFHQKMVDYLVRYCGANKDAASMLAKAAADHVIDFEKAIEICKATTGISEDGSVSGGAGAFLPSLHATPKQYKGPELEEDAPMLAHGKADISTYIKDKFTKVEGRPKGLTAVQQKDLWGTAPTAMSERLREMSLQNPGIEEFLTYLKDNPEIVEKLGFSELQDVIDYLESTGLEAWDELRGDLNKIIGGKDIGMYEQDDLQENYNRFKKETKIRPKQDQYHEAIKVVNKKLDEVNRILEFTSRMREELSEGEEMLEVKTRTAKTMEKVKAKIAEAYKKLKQLN